jgi:GntR family transcriptional regulator, transcriptional repressor for pyruvate dehydrogenase complex
VLRDLHRQRLYDAVAEELRRFIANSGLRAGDRLPSERELCERLRVGRTTLREALRLLQMSGLIDIRHGRGAFIRQEDLGDFLVRSAGPALRAGVDLPDLAEMRSLLEVQAARLAAERRTLAQLSRFEEHLARAEQLAAKGGYSVDDDMEFHGLVFEAAGNTVLCRFVSIVHELLRSLAGVRFTSSVQVLANTEHRAIYQAIRDRRPSKTAALMAAHIRDTSEAAAASDCQSAHP